MRRLAVAQVELAGPPADDLADARGLEGADDRGADQPVVTGHVDLDVVPGEFRLHGQQLWHSAPRCRPAIEASGVEG